MKTFLIYYLYIRQVLIHRYHVGVQCWKHGLWFAPFFHDNSKLSPTEFKAYANYFLGDRDKWKERFQYAWNNHWKVNKHHHQYWIVDIKKEGKHEVLKMPARYLVEMYCDWVAAGIAYTGSNNVKRWFVDNYDKMIFHDQTSEAIKYIVMSDEVRRKKYIKAILKVGY